MEGTAGAAIARSAVADQTMTTAEDTLKQKGRASNFVSGGHLVAKADVKATAVLMPSFRSCVSPIYPERGASAINDFLSDDTAYVGHSDDVPHGTFAHVFGGYSEKVCDAEAIAPALRRTREVVAEINESAVVTLWVYPRECAPATKSRTMYK